MIVQLDIAVYYISPSACSVFAFSTFMTRMLFWLFSLSSCIAIPRYFSDGFATLSCSLPVLCSKWWIVLPTLSEVWRYGTRSAFQYCQLFAAHIHDRPCHRAEGRLIDHFTWCCLKSDKVETLVLCPKKLDWTDFSDSCWNMCKRGWQLGSAV